MSNIFDCRNCMGDRVYNDFGERIDNIDRNGEEVGVVCSTCGFYDLEEQKCRLFDIPDGVNVGSCDLWAYRDMYEKEMFEKELKRLRNE